MNRVISVIVPVYNSEDTLPICLNSIVRQSYQDLEIIIVDDGSKDRSLEISKSFEQKDFRIHVLHEENKGVSAARNYGISIASGRFLSFVDSDDILEQNYFSKLLSPMQENFDVIISGLLIKSKEKGIQKINPNNIGKFSNEIWNEIASHPQIFGYAGGKLFRTEIIKNSNLQFDVRKASQEDLDFCLSYYEKCNSFFLMDAAGYIYNYTPPQRVIPYKTLFENKIKIWNISENKYPLSSEALRTLYEDIAQQLFVFAYTEYSKRNFEEKCTEVQSIDGMHELLNTIQCHGEEGIITRLFIRCRYKEIQHYMRVRNFVKKILRRH